MTLPVAGVAVEELLGGLEAAEAALAEHLAVVCARYGHAALGVIDLPALDTPRGDSAQVDVYATLYWAREIEAAGLLPMVEALAAGFVSGDFAPQAGRALEPLLRIWRSRDHRFARQEREALFARLFEDIDPVGPAQIARPVQPVQPGQPGAMVPPTAPDGLPPGGYLRALAEAIVAYGRTPNPHEAAPYAARVAMLADELRLLASQRGTGIAAFAARDIVAQVREALTLLGRPEVLRALSGATSAWDAIRRFGPMLLGRPVHPDRHVARATSGQRLLAWLRGSGRLTSRTDPVISDAQRWLLYSEGVA